MTKTARTDYPDFTKDRPGGGLPPTIRRNWLDVIERLKDLPPEQYALIEVAPNLHRANSVRKNFNLRYPEVRISQRLQPDGKIHVFAAMRNSE